MPGALTREGLVAGSLLLGVVLAVALLPWDAAWAHGFGGFHFHGDG